MNKQLKIVSFPDKNPEYLQLQIDSYNKHMKDIDTELIIINASTHHEDEINQICKDNNIKCIKYTGRRDIQWDSYYIEQLHWFRDTVQCNVSDYILLMHSDMFFINRLDYKSLMNNS